MTKARRAEQPDEARAAASESADDQDTEGQSLQNYELVRAISHERLNEAARLARDNARAREAREAKRGK
ncbi:MAG TPA: hypothetical protein VFS32_09210 [Candidatus Limnocylindrales bacterium]|nr:hypothetical protein [Candidatus Limnocylindrales bacterium]